MLCAWYVGFGHKLIGLIVTVKMGVLKAGSHLLICTASGKLSNRRCVANPQKER